MEDPAPPAALVMTSGNRSDEPIATGNRQALNELADIADVFLLHDRDILVRADDSVLRLGGDGNYQFMRRARGYAPLPLEFELAPAPRPRDPSCVLGVGAELKNTICFVRENERPGPDSATPTGVGGFVSQHIGDVTHPGTEAFMRAVTSHLRDLFGFKPGLIVRDLHPDYLSSRFADELGATLGVPVLTLQHHFAHAFSVLMENNHRGEALVLALDGSGLGDDGSIWGGELIRAHTISGEAERIGHIARTLTPGGDAAAREPWRMAQAYMYEIGQSGDWQPEGMCNWFRQEFAEQSDLIGQMLPKQLNSPVNSSTGRLFDAIAGLLGFGSLHRFHSDRAAQAKALATDPAEAESGAMSYEGQAAMWLESIQDKSEKQPYPCSINQYGHTILLNTLELFGAACENLQSGVAPGVIARRFHLGLVNGLARLAEAGAQTTGISCIGLSGGVMHNATLAALLPARLREMGLTPLTHQLLPPGDGCISFGQAVWGMLRQKG